MLIKFTDWFVFGILGLSKNTHLGSAIHFFIYDVLKILFLLFTIITVISFLRTYIDNTKLRTYIAKRPKFIAHLLASILGAITPFCSCSSIPVFIGFIESGIPFGIAMSFIITSPMINEIAVLVLAGILGLKVTILYVSTGILVGMMGGYLMEKLGYKKYLQDYLLKLEEINMNTSTCSCSKGEINQTLKDKIKNSLQYAKELLNRIWIFVLIGVGFGAFLHGYVPTEFITQYLGANNILAVPIAVLCGIPLYSDVTTIIPIAQVLINKGGAIGTVLVFMMSIVALSLPEMIIISRVMKKELVIRFIVFMFITFTVVGYLYNFIL